MASSALRRLLRGRASERRSKQPRGRHDLDITRRAGIHRTTEKMIQLLEAKAVETSPAKEGSDVVALSDSRPHKRAYTTYGSRGSGELDVVIVAELRLDIEPLGDDSGPVCVEVRQ